MRTPQTNRSLLSACALALIGAGALRASATPHDTPDRPPGASRPIDYARDVRPILETRCYACHGPKKQKAGLRLDEKAAAFRVGSDGVEAIRPGHGTESELVRRVGSLDPEERMPPEGDRLTPEQIGILRDWIDQGASWPDELSGTSGKARGHWAFRPPVRPAVPAVRTRDWARTPIDCFILARLEARSLSPSPEADRVTLLRRLSLDLIGLPPSVEAVEAFVADTRADAYERVVERLLASPHHGERWGRHWLDAARYADSDGYEKDKSRVAWSYRDWVINALNRDLPYDRFIIEQIAGDRLPGASQDQVVATGFLRNSMINEEGGIDPEQFRMEAMFDRMDAIGKGILGLTIQCAQCHSHKYDPISQEEYYRLFAFLNNDHEAQPVVYTPAQLRTVAEISRQVREIEARLRHTTPDWRARMATWEESVKGGQPRWVVLSPTQVSEADTRFLPLEDGSLLAQGYAPAKFTYVFEATSDLPEIRAFRLELLTDPNLPANGPGRSFKGTCTLSEFEVEAADAREPGKKRRVKLVKATADYANEDRDLEPSFDDRSGRKRVTGRVEFTIDGKGDTAWGIDAGPGRRNTDRKAVFVAEDDVAFPGGTVLTFHLVSKHGGWNNNDHQQANHGRFRLSATGARAAIADPLPRRVREILAVPAARRSPAEEAVVFSYWRTTVPEFKEANERIEVLRGRWPEGTTALTLMAREKGRTTALLKRGDWLKPGKEVTPGVPAILHPLPDRCEPTRLAFARWLVDRRSPTTARVFVNRIWQSYFGTGLVSTSEDLGTQAEAPSHPELLDWLACEFMDRGWSMKALHRLIVGSAAYRQSSRVTPGLHARDPDNRLLARGPRFRVEAEIVRDIALASSGLLNPRLGGASIYAPAPGFLFLPPASYAPFPWKEETGPDRYRRAVYTFRRRSTPYPMLATFDAPNGDAACVRRLRSNTPLQALTTLNETVFVECARALAREILVHGGRTDRERVDYAFRRVLARTPTDDERKVLLGLLETQFKRIAEGRVNARELATGTSAPPDLPPGVSPAQLAAYTVVSRVLLNLDEAITKE
jgi:mono/diheme cytochrome c family protein